MVKNMVQKTTSTRDQILALLKKEARMTVTEMALQLGITEMAVRRHLNTLERDHLVETTLVRQAMGRPLYVYHLTTAGDELFPRKYSALTLEFLKDLEEMSGEETIAKLFERREQRLNKTYSQRMEGKTFQEKVAELAVIQNENGYMVEWEQQDDDTYVLKEFNCPISQVANEYQQACSCERSLFQKVLGTSDVDRVTCMAKGGDNCRYVIKENKQQKLT
jgi:iron-sulfur cluster biosynthesis transcriptional regulator SufR